MVQIHHEIFYGPDLADSYGTRTSFYFVMFAINVAGSRAFAPCSPVQYAVQQIYSRLSSSLWPPVSSC